MFKGKLMEFVEGFVVAVPNDKKQEYIQHAKEAAVIFKDHGASKLVECWGEDVPDGKLTSFPMAVKCKPDETVVFSWIIWPSKADRDTGMPKIMDDPRLNNTEMPFDGSRLIFGGFQMVVNE